MPVLKECQSQPSEDAKSMNQHVDLHMHTIRSDGMLSPAELLESVRSADIAAFSVTDHDTLQGYLDIREMLNETDPQLIPGVELSTNYKEQDLHILAYAFDPDYFAFKNALVEFQQARRRRGEEMVKKLNGLGVNISYDDVKECAVDAVVGRPHVAEAIFKSGATARYEEAFQTYIGTNGPAYVPKENFEPAAAFELVHQAGGIAVLAHPGVNDAYLVIDELVEMGLDGIEVLHPEHSQSLIDKLKQKAKDLGLCTTGGSDYHGRSGRDQRIGSQKVPYAFFAELLSRIKRNGTEN